MRVRAPLLSFAAILSCLACGAAPPPKAAAPAVADDAPEVIAPAPRSEPAKTPAPEAAQPASPAPSAPSPPEKADECAPVTMAFEASLRHKLKKCWSDGAKAKPNERIIGSVRYLVEIDGTGKIATQKQLGDSELPAPMQACMLKAVKAEKIDGPRCAFKSLTIEEKFPR